MRKRRKTADPDAAVLLSISHELEEDGDDENVCLHADNAVALAREAVLASGQLSFDETNVAILAEPEPPPALVASIGLAIRGSLTCLSDLPVARFGGRRRRDLVAARLAFEESQRMWPGNAVSMYRLADLELHHGDFQRAHRLYASAASLPPAALTASSSGKPAGVWYARLVAAPRAEAVAAASYMLALLLHLTRRCDDAVKYLMRLGIRHRLSPAVWATIRERPLANENTPTSLPRAEAAPGGATAEVARFSDAVPPALLRQLISAFGPHAPFWVESGYADRGYFSFWLPVREGQAPTNALEALARRLLPLTGCASEVVGIEWWVHSKAASRSLGNQHGHQMHFDTEEGLARRGEVAHPAVSSVLYLSDCGASGPTVVLDQRYAGTPATSAHISHPQKGHVLLFPGDRLHAVCPAAPPSRTQRAREGSGKLHAAWQQPRRVTLMLGFWTRDVASALGPRLPYTACGPMPRVSRACSWPATLAIPPAQPAVDEGGSDPLRLPTRHPVPRVRPAWETLPSLSCCEDDAWAGMRLAVPQERNTHVFVKGMDEFLFDHIEQAC